MKTLVTIKWILLSLITLSIWWYLIPSLLGKIREIDITIIKIILFVIVSLILMIGSSAIVGYTMAQISMKIENINLLKQQIKREKKLNQLLTRKRIS